eukprot:GEMP01103527.1.p1 GENE.GEMP01103527.1~~GEMP01103527.1.p1  ORF type:complete len:116 (+),score=27.99 GEMP01103527.1:214-561(+)
MGTTTVAEQLSRVPGIYLLRDTDDDNELFEDTIFGSRVVLPIANRVAAFNRANKSREDSSTVAPRTVARGVKITSGPRMSDTPIWNSVYDRFLWQEVFPKFLPHMRAIDLYLVMY